MVRSNSDALMLMLGGQTSHACGLYELGVCSAEAWGMDITAGLDGSFELQWSRLPQLSLPFTPRCGSALLWNAHPRLQLRVVAGQLSYASNDSHTCSAAPTTVNDVWLVTVNSSSREVIGNWSLDEAAPFSPRRFHRLDSCSDTAGFDVYRYSPAFGTDCWMMGGIAYTALSSDAAGQARLSGSVVFSDSYYFTSDWGGWRDSFALPAPLDASPLTMHSDRSEFGMDLGGRTSQRFLDQWRRTRPLVDTPDSDMQQLAINLTLLTLLIDGDRLQLPLNATLDEGELNDPQGPYQLGSDWMTAFVKVLNRDAMGVIYPQPRAVADSPTDASWFVPQAASSFNTSRPQLNFALRRHSHRSSRATWPEWRLDPDDLGLFELWTLSGGRSGATYFNDVISVQPTLCLPPVDPSFWDVLGAGLRMRLPVAGTQAALGAAFGGWSALDAPLTVYCDDGWHFEPPLEDSEVDLHCVVNGMWMDPTVYTIRRCVPDRLNCALPLQDLGERYCQPALPVITRISASYYERLGDVSSLITVTGPDEVTLEDVPVRELTLTIWGNAFFRPLQVRVDGYECDEPTLEVQGTHGPAVVDFNFTSLPGVRAVLIAGEWGDVITCQLPPTLGVRMAVVVISGIIGSQVEVSQHLAPRVATLSNAAPALTRISNTSAADCWQDPRQLPPLALSSCPNDRGFEVTVCATRASIGEQEEVLSVQAVLEDGATRWTLQCSPLWVGDATAPLDRCTSCRVSPHLNTVSLVLQRASSVSQPATIAFTPCLPGTRNDYAASTSADATRVCAPCPAGTSTDNVESASQCLPCIPGHYSHVNASSQCSACEAGTFANSTGSVTCLACPPNTYANSTGRSSCEGCELNQYLVLASDADIGIVGRCANCPEDARCMANGTILASAGAYLLVDHDASTVSTTPCSWLACLDASQCLASSTESSAAAPTIARSHLPVVNCCAQGRFPAYVDCPSCAGLASLELSGGYNVLCAECLPGHTQVNGSCVHCPSTDVGLLLAVLLLSLLAVYCIHRLPHDWTGSATLLVSSNLLQLSALFLAAESLPHLASILNVSLSNSIAGVCIAPMDDAQRIALQLSSPLLAFALLACVALLQLALRAVTSRASHQPRLSQPLHRLYRLLFLVPTPFTQSPQPPNPAAFNAFDLSTSLLSDEAESSSQGELKQPHPQRRQVPDLTAASSGSDVITAGSSREASADDLSATSASFASIGLAYQRTAVRLLLLSYTGLSSICLQSVHWQEVGEFGWRLTHFPTLSRQSLAFRRLQPALVVVLAMVCALPALLTVYLYLEHRRGALALVKRRQQPQLREAAMPGYAVAAVDVRPPSLSSSRSALLLQLTAMYRLQCWWMASFVLVRRLLLVALLTALRDPYKWVWLTLANHLLLLLHALIQPYERPRDNALETLALLSLSLQTTLLSAYPPPYLSAPLLAAFNALVIVPVLPLLMECGTRCRCWPSAAATSSSSKPTREPHSED